MRQLKITIAGSSVALRVRPPEMADRTKNKVYGSLLEEKLNRACPEKVITVVNKGITRGLVLDALEEKDKLIRTFPDFFIINIGVVDAPNREMPRWFSDIIFKRRNRNLFRICNFFYLTIIKKYFRTPLVYLRGKRSWVGEKKFEKKYRELVEVLLKETSARLILLGVNQGNERIEKSLPGTLVKFKRYSSIIHTIASEYDLDFIDVSHLNSARHFPDGIHYNSLGHEIIAGKLFEKINKYL